MLIIDQILEMDPSDEDYLPDPERPSWINVGSKERKPPDPTRQGQKRKLDDDFTKGKCFFIFLISVEIKVISQ